MEAAGEQVLVIKGLSFSINQVDILKDISLSVSKGELVGLIGPNGAGKTTLLKCINGINRTQASVYIKDDSLEKMSDKKVAMEIALMHQNTTTSFPFPVLDVVLMGRYPHLKRLQGESREDYRIARRNMEYTGTLSLENKPITCISGGERQRVFFAKVLTQETDIILLDEPTASLDITHQEQIFKYSRELCDSGKTVIAAVHDLKIAARFCSRLIMLKEGRIIADGTPEEVLTSENLSDAYAVNALVYSNNVTGQLDFYLHDRKPDNGSCLVHVIGGGGSASGVLRQLFENGFRVSAGVFSPADSDLHCAEVFGIKRVVCEPFSDISSETAAENISLIEKADMTILCNMPFGRQNLLNLEAAAHARKLVIVEDEAPESRDFTGGVAIKLYNELKKNAIVTTSARLHEVV